LNKKAGKILLYLASKFLSRVIDYYHHQDDDSRIKSICQGVIQSMKENLTIRQAAKAAGIPLWRIAIALNVGEATLTRWLRTPLPKEKENQILSIIATLEKEGV